MYYAIKDLNDGGLDILVKRQDGTLGFHYGADLYEEDVARYTNACLHGADAADTDVLLLAEATELKACKLMAWDELEERSH